jgi:stage II sporulation protein D
MDNELLMRKIGIILLVFLGSFPIQGQVKVRLLTEANPDYFFFKVQRGSYNLDIYNNSDLALYTGDIVLVSRYNNRLAIKVRGHEGLLADSLCFRKTTDENVFNVMTNNGEYLAGSYSGDLSCIPDFGGILLINTCDIETYIAGVVKAEGGNGKTLEYFRVQAVIARTYTYRNLNKHLADGYDLCDDIHCQAFNGIITDTLILGAVNDTKDLVIATRDSGLIISAFHSNCGGETAPSEYVWLTAQPYLTGVEDPFCLQAKNAKWEKSVSLTDWIGMLKKKGISDFMEDADSFTFNQSKRVQTYEAGNISLPLREIREYFDLRSTFFNVRSNGDSILLEGKGYGHGVGLCQEGAMVMALSGKSFREIISFYYPGVLIMCISDAKKDVNNIVSLTNSYAN